MTAGARDGPALRIVAGDLTHPRIVDLLQAHWHHAKTNSPPESVHALDLAELGAPDICFWAAWEGETLLGMGAMKHLTPAHAEVKSMHTAAAARRMGVGATMLRHIIGEARQRGYARLSLETGSMESYAPARALYARHGFTECPPFGSYRNLDPNSMFMTLELSGLDQGLSS